MDKTNIKYITDRKIFESDADVLINSVNVKGVMGAGIAREFKKRFPEMYKDYLKACRKGEIRIRAKFIVDLKDPKKPLLKILEIYDWRPHIWISEANDKKRIILNFPTKIYWDLPSDYRIIKAGLEWLRKNIDLLSQKLGRKIKKIAMPQIGCGLGGLEWKKVKNLIEHYLSDTGIEIEIYIYK